MKIAEKLPIIKGISPIRPLRARGQFPWPNGSFLLAEFKPLPSSRNKLMVRIGGHELMARKAVLANGAPLAGKHLVQLQHAGNQVELRLVHIDRLIAHVAKIAQLTVALRDERPSISERLTRAFQSHDLPIEVRMERAGELQFPYAALVEMPGERDRGSVRLSNADRHLVLRLHLKFHAIEHLFVELKTATKGWQVTIYEPSGQHLQALREAFKEMSMQCMLTVKGEFPQWARLKHFRT